MSEVRRCATTMSRQRSIKKLKLFKDEPIKETNSRTPESYGPRGVRSPLENISNKTPSPLNEEIKRKTPQSSKSNGKLKTKSQFEQLEKEGLLTLDILDQFKNNQDITVVNMTPSFAPIKNEIGLVLQSKGNVKSCTKPFYHGFKNLLFLDITRVPIHDDEIRYLIRLCKLRGLSLSYTEITFKGMKYLSHHAQFKDTLEVLKLAGIEGLDDSWLPLVQTFTNLNIH
ncbi:hypothetical protein O9G_001386 [Rozella allomycis CSF55]|uniref:Uncharacterized protein n=1 Tax=Rozella allomycis (strain CSF55) TaxID=988480 RepID=A0A075B5B7_ROZAC|nr:hypothetical protein O9G_001386 [Rozella allomycis CSF55]|eukprot:EPZ36941.1 hypothetical protein O9G_001386 [Rozella allomycis CSF55]